ncbi:hypothetical protein PUNSTDRAFT_120545 [Punctularia strigosozonata HHB-11173 SS5]|uniref:uncharacterized protein n=1 Tax=Punctularia strigosozonata (strain HHB-11173) TaxID=741275 RepID=UPI0004417E36|nr:uncharacterized protein PUNSTDRAFT_120545 [Punctularia strigosozonata HHB-11173 SS5]EIN09146.1 hypothetical protein PUNSTDRAFT_120545 [Punctularia strigosozonata HHB-11173 SS5]
MSLISDTDFLIHNIRLNYLRNVDDPYARRILSFPTNHALNQHILAAGLSDTSRFPEILATASPEPSDSEDPSSHSIRPSGFPGATGLKYTQTILGPTRSGALGMRVSGRRGSVKRISRGLAGDDLAPTTRSDDGSSVGGASKHSPVASIHVAVEGPTPDATPLAAVGVTVSEHAPAKDPVFVPKFKGAAEMEARRRQRMMARQRALTSRTGVPAATARDLNPDLSSSSDSSEDERAQPVSDESDDAMSDFDAEDVPEAEDDLDEDDFDLDFNNRNEPSGSEWDAASTTSSAPEHSPHINPPRHRPRLSPVAEVFPPKTFPRATSQLHTGSTIDDSELFIKQRPPPVPVHGKSALSAMLASSSSTTNPFSELYGAVSGKGETSSQATSITVFFPKSMSPSRPMELMVKRDATVEEVLGFALWNYWEEGWMPKLDNGMEGWADRDGEDGEKWKVRMSTVGWIMRIAEEDGEVDEDFPPPDRTGKISKFNFDAYAVLEASPQQIQQNKILESKIQRPTARLAPAKKRSDASTSNLTPNQHSLAASVSGISAGSMPLSSVGLSSSLGPSSAHGPQLFLRVRVADAVDSVHVSTTIPVSAGMYLQEALELICRKRHLEPKEFALLIAQGEKKILIPLDRTVASLQGTSDLVLVKKSMLPSFGIDELKRTGRTTDPNASIFKRMSEIPEQQLFGAGVDLTTAYKKYTIYKKTNMLVGRQERTLAIDGAYIHIMPSSGRAKAVFESGKTMSYHMKDIACQQSNKSSSTFKLVVHRDDGKKRFEFEAESPDLAREIAETIKGVRASLERSGTIKNARRSRHVG